MKKITYIIAFAAFLAAACQKNEVAEEPASDPQYNKILTAGVTDEPLTRVGFDENNSFYWHKGDQIGVLTSGGLKVMTLDEQYHKQPSGVFYGTFAEDIGEYAVYPYGNHVIENGQLTFLLPSSYNYTYIEDDCRPFQNT